MWINSSLCSAWGILILAQPTNNQHGTRNIYWHRRSCSCANRGNTEEEPSFCKLLLNLDGDISCNLANTDNRQLAHKLAIKKASIRCVVTE